MPFDPDRWWESREHRAAAALFDRGAWLEAHEAFESLWIELPRGSADAALLQGLIQAAVALHKLATGHRGAAERLARRAASRLRRAGRRLGVDGSGVAAALETHLSDPRAAPPRLDIRWPHAMP